MFISKFKDKSSLKNVNVFLFGVKKIKIEPDW
jgi:hypothetical protein